MLRFSEISSLVILFLFDETICKTVTLWMLLIAFACLSIKSPFVGNSSEGYQLHKNKICNFLFKNDAFLQI